MTAERGDAEALLRCPRAMLGVPIDFARKKLGTEGRSFAAGNG